MLQRSGSDRTMKTPFRERLMNFFEAFQRPKMLVMEDHHDVIRMGEVLKTRFPDGPKYKYQFETVYDIIWDDGEKETVPTHHFQWQNMMWVRRVQ